MVIYEAVYRNTVDPLHRGNMVELGYQIHLEPGLYEKHRIVAERLNRSPAWKQVELAEKKPAEPAKPSDGLFSHQRQVLERLRSKETV